MCSGLLTGLLEPLTGPCTGLRTLTLRKVGYRNIEECDCVEDFLRSLNAFGLLIEWSSFIESVVRDSGRNQIRTRSAAGRSSRSASSCSSRSNYGHGFRFTVFLVLLAGPWPRLKVMKVRGVRSWVGQDERLPNVKVEDQYEGLPFAVSLEEQLKGCRGAGGKRACGREG